MPKFIVSQKNTLSVAVFFFSFVLIACQTSTLNESSKPENKVDKKTDLLIQEPEEFRLSDYKAPVPQTLKGGGVIDVTKAKQLFDEKETLFVDVLYYRYKPKNLPEGTLWIPKARKNIPGSIWPANTGQGVLSDELKNYFLENLKKYTDGNQSKKVVFYCLPGCWLSWNAAKRAILNGYKNVYWFPGGTVAWKQKNYPLQNAEPLPLP